MTMANFAALLQRFFTDRLQSQLGVSPHTIASYRDTFRLLLDFASERLGQPPSWMRVEDIKRHERRPVEFLTEEETEALVAAPDPTTWIGRRDRTLLLLAVETGLRNTEIRSLRCRDVDLGVGAHVRWTTASAPALLLA